MYLDDISLDYEFTTEPVTIDRDKMIAFAKEYDPIPLHYDEEYAKTTRYGRIIAPGVMSFMAVWAKVVECDLFGDELVAGKSTKIEWLAPVYAGDVLTGKCRVSRIERRNPYNGIAETTLEVYNQDGLLVLTNITESIVRYREQENI